MTEVIKSLSEENFIAIDRLLLNSKKIQAIKMVMKLTRTHVGEAKVPIEIRQSYLCEAGLAVMAENRRYCEATEKGSAWLAEHEEPVELNPKRHFYLYAKGHYERSDDMIADLKKIASNYCGLERIRTEEVSIFLNSEVYPEVARNENTFSNFWKGCAPSPSTYKGVDDEEYYVRVIRKMLSILNLTKVCEGDTILINLGEPDPDILPLRKENHGSCDIWKEVDKLLRAGKRLQAIQEFRQLLDDVNEVEEI